jgi:hypothetical protein
VDKIAPDIMDFLTPAEITKQRFAIQIGKEPAEILPLIIAKKSPFMQFDSFMLGFHSNLMQELENKLS